MSTQNYMLKQASKGPRFCAFLIDGFISLTLCIPSVLALFVAIEYGSFGVSLFFYLLSAFLYLVPFLYNLLKDGMGQGQSVGKRLTHIKVVSLRDEKPCSFGMSAGRNIIMGILNLIPIVGWILEPIMVLFETNGRRLGDMVVQTMVLDCESEKSSEGPFSGVSGSERTLLTIMAFTVMGSLFFEMIFPFLGLGFYAARIIKVFFFLLKIGILISCAIISKDKFVRIVLWVFSAVLILMWGMGMAEMFFSGII